MWKKTRMEGLINESADMPELVECRICGRNTRTEWRSPHGSLWACPDEEENVVWNRILNRKKR